MNQVVTKDQLEQQAARIPGASQATGIEQSRAVAEVQASVAVAHRFPRNEAMALKEVKEAGGKMHLAERAFYSFPRGGQAVTGSSIALAVEVARAFGNIDYGIMELDRDDERGHTEMLAFAWDLQKNIRARQTFIVPHSRDTRGGRKPLTDMRDIYENNANNGARRLRECIFRVVPTYFRVAAEQACRATLEKGEDSASLPERVSRTIKAFEEIGVSLARLEKRQGKSDNWTPVDLANLHIVFQSIKNGETTITESFEVVSTEETSVELHKRVEQQKADDRALDPTPEPSQAEAAEQTAQDIDGPLDEGSETEPAPEPGEPTNEPTTVEAEYIADEGVEIEPEPADGEQDLSTAKFLEMRKAIQSAKTLVGVNLAVQEWQNHSHVYSDKERAQVTADIDKAQERIRNTAEKK